VDHCEVCHASIKAISILDPVDVEEEYSHIASHFHSVQCHVPSYGWHDAIFALEEESTQGRLVLHCEVNSIEAVRIVC